MMELNWVMLHKLSKRKITKTSNYYIWMKGMKKKIDLIDLIDFTSVLFDWICGGVKL